MMGTIHFTNDKSKIDFDFVFEYLHHDAYWCKGISKENLNRQIDHSVCFSAFEGDKQIGFGRVITDFNNLGFLADVFISKSHQGQGVGKAFMAHILNHEDFKNLRRWLLRTEDAHGLYAQFGFTAIAKPEMFMERSVGKH